ncbi:hypothetical protein EH221_06220 [bacterium]|nr:MAG: hypothetical protein EH221_06220 [bacterium]
MLSLTKITSSILCCWSLLFLLVDQQVCGRSDEHLTPPAATRVAEPDGYTDIVSFGDTLIAVGSDGRIDRITQSGERLPIDHNNSFPLNCAFSNDKIVIAAGDHGTILYSSDGKNFYRAESGTDKNIHGVTFNNGLMIAGTDNGMILSSNDSQSWRHLQTNAKGNILSLASNPFFVIGITDAGEIIQSFDGIDWEIKDYNKEYAGYNPYSKFKKILATQNTIVIIGTHDDGSPSILSSTLGNVWAERFPIYHDDGMICSLTSEPNGIAYDSGGDQFILACDQGELLSLPVCTKCNEYKKISENNLNAIIYLDDRLVIVGDEFSVFVQRL